jgi:hypothetical protein
MRTELHGSDFHLVDVPDELLGAVRKSAFTERGDHWVRTFPPDAPHLDRAWANFQRLIHPWLRQAAGLDPVPWADTLAVVCDRLDGAGVDWWLTGSAALAVRGLAITPGDLDLVVSDEDAHRVGDLLLDGLVEPVAPADWFCRWWGRAVLGARVEWIGGVGPSADHPDPSDFGPLAAAHLTTLTWRNWQIRVPPLELQRAVSQRRGLTTRVHLIDTTPTPTPAPSPDGKARAEAEDGTGAGTDAGAEASGEPAERWIVWRQDDNGNRYQVARKDSRADADALATMLEARGHKQFYWVAAAT